MTFKTFAKRIAVVFAIFGFASLVQSALQVEAALGGQAVMALLPVGIAAILLVRLSRRSARTDPAV